MHLTRIYRKCCNYKAIACMACAQNQSMHCFFSISTMPMGATISNRMGAPHMMMRGAYSMAGVKEERVPGSTPYRVFYPASSNVGKAPVGWFRHGWFSFLAGFAHCVAPILNEWRILSFLVQVVLWCQSFFTPLRHMTVCLRSLCVSRHVVGNCRTVMRRAAFTRYKPQVSTMSWDHCVARAWDTGRVASMPFNATFVFSPSKFRELLEYRMHSPWSQPTFNNHTSVPHDRFDSFKWRYVQPTYMCLAFTLALWVWYDGLSVPCSPVLHVHHVREGRAKRLHGVAATQLFSCFRVLRCGALSAPSFVAFGLFPYPAQSELVHKQPLGRELRATICCGVFSPPHLWSLTGARLVQGCPAR